MMSLKENSLLDLEFTLKTMTEKNLTVATAESCTGGLIGAKWTELSGSSSVYMGGVTTYSNESKKVFLGVEQQVIEEFGAVCEQVASKMAESIRCKLATSIGVSVTGIAGPTGGTTEKPVGTVWAGFSTSQGTHAEKLHFKGNRAQVRQQTVDYVMNKVSEYANNY
jgi:nicotinamide-nucleotide amidase